MSHAFDKGCCLKRRCLTSGSSLLVDCHGWAGRSLTQTGRALTRQQRLASMIWISSRTYSPTKLKPIVNVCPLCEVELLEFEVCIASAPGFVFLLLKAPNARKMLVRAAHWSDVLWLAAVVARLHIPLYSRALDPLWVIIYLSLSDILHLNSAQFMSCSSKVSSYVLQLN